jgi:transcriptional regulator with XRE-family HTH domain
MFAKNISKMDMLTNNLRYLRAKRGYTQQRVADNLIITRGCYAKYEEGIAEPPLITLQRIAQFYDVSIDVLLQADLRHINPYGLNDLQKALHVLIEG